METCYNQLLSILLCSSGFLFFLIGIHSMQGWTAARGMELQEKKDKKDYRIQKICLERTYS